MSTIERLFLTYITICLLFSPLYAIEETDVNSINTIIANYTKSWNERGCHGFADDFTEDADFINIFGMVFKGREEIEQRHVQILATIYKGSKLEILDTQLREIQPGIILALIRWKLYGYHTPRSDLSLPGETREGIFSQLFIESHGKWEITASQNTMNYVR